MHNLAHNVPVLNSPSSFVYNQFGTYGTTYNQVCQVCACKCVIIFYIFKIIKLILFDIYEFDIILFSHYAIGSYTTLLCTYL